MYPRTNYEMTEADLEKILEAYKPTPCIMIGGYVPPSPQENANHAWAELGKRMGFDPMTVEPIDGKGQRFFSAVLAENETQRAERLERQKRELREAEIKGLRIKMAEAQKRLDELISQS